MKEQHQKTSHQASVGSGVSSVTGNDKPPYFDFSVLKSRTVQILLCGTCIANLGVTSPLFLLVSCAAQLNIWPYGLLRNHSSHSARTFGVTAVLYVTTTSHFLCNSFAQAGQVERDGIPYVSMVSCGSNCSSCVIEVLPKVGLHVCLGLAIVFGASAFGFIVVKNSTECMISRQYLCQVKSDDFERRLTDCISDGQLHDCVIVVGAYVTDRLFRLRAICVDLRLFLRRILLLAQNDALREGNQSQ